MSRSEAILPESTSGPLGTAMPEAVGDGGVPDGAPPARTVAPALRAIEAMDNAGLRREWRRLYRANPPARLSRDLLLLAVAWKVQEQVHGGLGPALKRRLAELAGTMAADGDLVRGRVARLKPGATLVRAWQGETHTVQVLDDGFLWNGQHWRSLSAIARAITGTHWSGPRFFGLTEPASAPPQDPAGAADHA